MSQAPYAVRNARWGTTFGIDLKVMYSWEGGRTNTKHPLTRFTPKQGSSLSKEVMV